MSPVFVWLANHDLQLFLTHINSKWNDFLYIALVETGVHFLSVISPQYGNFVDNLRLYVRGGSGGMGLPRLGGQGGKGGDVWVVAKKNMTLKRIKDKHPEKRFVGGAGGNSRFVPTHSSYS